MGHPAAQCIRCHKVGSTGGVLGPDLSKIASRLPMEKILESLVNPQAELAEGYACFDTQDYNTGYQAFLAKKKPDFKGK